MLRIQAYVVLDSINIYFLSIGIFRTLMGLISFFTLPCYFWVTLILAVLLFLGVLFYENYRLMPRLEGVKHFSWSSISWTCFIWSRILTMLVLRQGTSGISSFSLIRFSLLMIFLIKDFNFDEKGNFSIKGISSWLLISSLYSDSSSRKAAISLAECGVSELRSWVQRELRSGYNFICPCLSIRTDVGRISVLMPSFLSVSSASIRT